MIVGITMLVLSFIYLLLTSIVYYSKKRIDNRENKIYNFLIIITFTGIVLELLCIFLTPLKIPILTEIVNRGFLIYILSWIVMFTRYIMVISFDNEKKLSIIVKKNSKVINVLFIVIYLLLVFGLMLLPLNYYFNGTYVYSYGTATNFLYFVTFLIILFWIICLILNLKEVGYKKYLPLFMFVLFAIINMIVREYNPGILLITASQTFITIMMYFTIENPDVKMINQLELAKEQADKANAAKTDFLSSMSHEIRTPLNAINGFSNLIEESQTLEEAKANAKDIINASDTLLEIVNGILDISKIEAGKLEIKESPYNARETFEELAKLITPRMEERGLDFTYYIAPDLPSTLYGDHANVKKIVTNFLSNACKYTERGFVRYEVNCVNTNDKCKLIISVEDSGRGIKKENVDKLFTKFDRLDIERNTTIEGTGLGLAITKQLVELMGGKIIVHTVYGEGSKFTVMLDQKIEKTEILEEAKPKSTIDLKNTKILLVDDNELNLKVGTKMLEKYGCSNVTQAHSGFECLDLVKENSYDLILLDDMMPKMSGRETLVELRKIPDFSIPVVALTANAISGMREKYLEQGFDEYLAKPIEKEEFIKVLNKTLSTNTVNKKVEVVENSEENVEELEPVVEESNNREEVPIEVEEPPEIDNETFLRNHGVDMDKALELLGDMEMYNATFNDFEKELESKWSRIEQEKLSGDMENYSIDVHSLKSDCKYLGFYDLADVSYEHELKSKENDVDFVNNNFDRLENEYAKVLHIVKEYKEKLL